jgi:hypothetical protein
VIREHEFYEELSALAAIGELSGEELAELESHLSDCERCGAAAADFTSIVHSDLPSLHSDSRGWLDKLANFFAWGQVEQRFRERADAQGYRFSPEVARCTGVARVIPAPRGLVALAPIFLLAIAAIGVATVKYRKVHSNYSASPDSQAPSRSAETLRLNTQIQEDATTIGELQLKLAETQSELKRDSERIAAAAQQREKLENENAEWHTALDAERAKSLALNAQAAASDQKYAELNKTTRRIELDHDADALEIASQQRQLEELNAELKAQNEVVGEEKQLLSVGRDVRDMMGARNLHIIDVFDTDVNGSRRRAFGRVFYSEGKSLVFYAFDLTGGGSPVNVKHSFQAWGLRDGANESAKSLGIFFVDDVAQKRWVLKVENPTVLEQIDSVFVTVEPFGGAEKPSAHKLLYAFLQNQPNHP